MPLYHTRFVSRSTPYQFQREFIPASDIEDLKQLYSNTNCELVDAHPVDTAQDIERVIDEELKEEESHIDWLDWQATRGDARNSGLPF